ncbi:hypothetical protein OTERR_29940 [Oryzomicrobium terrae]|uniref:Lipoprotein n=1 Tax=Oryzomicrobium terrae TaxID=1735038 RepID=A0A5C1EBY8_9RHOO|nr:hypothetical protein [Oryzomicrobium terrae]QEL66470.1 hypothetical protein OTERR_29940 [Oryzomicrobium terrae]
MNRTSLILITSILLYGCTDYAEETKSVKAYCKSIPNKNCLGTADIYAMNLAVNHFGIAAMMSSKTKHCGSMRGIDALACNKEAFGDNTNLGLLALIKKEYSNSNKNNNTTIPQPKPSLSSENQNGNLLTELEGRDFSYTITKLEPKDAANTFTLMATTPSHTNRHPINDNPIYRDAKIISEPGNETIYPRTTVLVGSTKILSTSEDQEGYQITNLISLDDQPELLLVDIFKGGNSCNSSQHVLVVRSTNGFNASKPFGRCAASWWHEKQSNTTYLTYPATEYEPMEIIAIKKTPR